MIALNQRSGDPNVPKYAELEQALHSEPPSADVSSSVSTDSFRMLPLDSQIQAHI